MTVSTRRTNRKKTYARRLWAGAAWCSVILLWLCALSVYINPSYCRYVSVLGLGFPFFMAGVLLVLVLTLLFVPRLSWIPFLGLVLCFFTIRIYCPLNIPQSPPKGAIKVLSYNTASFGSNKQDSSGRNAVVGYIADSKADIVCLQEAILSPVLRDSVIPALLDRCLPYRDTIQLAANVIACYSRYPIVGKKVISHNGSNGSGVFLVRLAPGDTLRVVNCHLESMHLSPDDRQQYHSMVRAPESSDVENSSRLLISKISAAAVKRSQQAVLTAKYVKENNGKSILLCGDFNDTPVSFTRHRIHSAGLSDAFEKTGNGIGRSFNRDAIYVRIDNIMCSNDWQPYGCRVDRSVTASDHYPIYAYFKRR